jgi:predicted outer membrane lipoprotein
MRHDAPLVLAVVGLLGVMVAVCFGVVAVMTYNKWMEVPVVVEEMAFGDGTALVYPQAGTVVYYRAPRK